MPKSARLGHLPPRVLGIVQAGGQGSRMDVLTRERAKPALPWGGTHQLIDFALSNLANSGIADVWVSVQYLAGTLDEHLQSGRRGTSTATAAAIAVSSPRPAEPPPPAASPPGTPTICSAATTTSPGTTRTSSS